MYRFSIQPVKSDVKLTLSKTNNLQFVEATNNLTKLVEMGKHHLPKFVKFLNNFTKLVEFANIFTKLVEFTSNFRKSVGLANSFYEVHRSCK